MVWWLGSSLLPFPGVWCGRCAVLGEWGWLRSSLLPFSLILPLCPLPGLIPLFFTLRDGYGNGVGRARLECWCVLLRRLGIGWQLLFVLTQVFVWGEPGNIEGWCDRGGHTRGDRGRGGGMPGSSCRSRGGALGGSFRVGFLLGCRRLRADAVDCEFRGWWRQGFWQGLCACIPCQRSRGWRWRRLSLWCLSRGGRSLG